MLDDFNKQQEIQRQKELRDVQRKDNARKTLKNYSLGKNKGLAKNTIKDAKNLAKSATPWGLFSLAFQMNPISDWMYGLALLAAIFKDFLDFLGATGILYGVIIVITFLVSIFIAMMMLLGSFSSGYGRAQQKIIRSWLVLLGGTTIEIILGINFLPIETLTVVIVYLLALQSRKQAREQKKEGEPWTPVPAEEGYA